MQSWKQKRCVIVNFWKPRKTMQNLWHFRSVWPIWKNSFAIKRGKKTKRARSVIVWKQRSSRKRKTAWCIRRKKRKSRNIWKKNSSSIVLQQSRRSQNTTAILPEKIKKAASCSFPRKSRWKNVSAVLRQISTDSSRRTTTASRKKNVCRSVLSTKKAITRDAEKSGSMTFRICSRN